MINREQWRDPCEKVPPRHMSSPLNLNRPITIERSTIADFIRDPNLEGSKQIIEDSARILCENVPPRHMSSPYI